MCVGLIKDIPTCKELLETMEREAEEVIAGLSKLVKPRAKL
jgi:NADH:quinone reductase (non-electrogenic)